MRETKNSSSSHLLTTILLHCMYLQQHSIDLHLSKKCIRSLEVNLGKECWERNECGERRNGREEKGHTTCWTLLNTKKVSACFLLPAALVFRWSSTFFDTMKKCAPFRRNELNLFPVPCITWGR
jgi:hypothetical protein